MGYISSVSIAPAVPESALPIGMEKEDESTQLIPIEPSEFVFAKRDGNSLHRFETGSVFLSFIYKLSFHQFWEMKGLHP